MVTATDISKAHRHELRLAFYDFAQRGEGDRRAVAAALDHWTREDALTPMESARWHDALDWRELGGLLPGWTLPKEMTGLRETPAESDLAAFEAWRARRSEAHAA